MGANCSSICNRYVEERPGQFTATISKADFGSCSSPLPVAITQRKDVKPNLLDIVFDNLKLFYISVEYSSNPPNFVITRPKPNMAITNASKGNTLIIKVVFYNVGLDYSYINGDSYYITPFVDCNGLGAQVNYTRSGHGSDFENYSTTSLQERITYSNLETIPRATLQVQTTLNGFDIGDASFTIYDEFTYYNSKEIPDNTCKNRTLPIEDIKTTILRQCCPYMVSVVRGEGLTLWDKLNYLFDNEDTGSSNVYEFYRNMAVYGMTKYYLSYLLYGKFNINYLLGKYNEKFLKKLGESRFCKFVEYFDENDYNKFFLQNI